MKCTLCGGRHHATHCHLNRDPKWDRVFEEVFRWTMIVIAVAFVVVVSTKIR